MSNDKLLASVGNRNITNSDLEYLKSRLDRQTAAQFNNEDGQKSLLQELIYQELFYLDAIDKNMDKDPDYVNEIERLKASILKQYAINKLLDAVSVEESEVEKVYNTNKSNFKHPTQVKASHILFDEKEKAVEVLSEIKQGLPFEDAAKKYSVCPSGPNGGDLGYFTKGRMVPEFESAAFSLELNIISDPVESPFGYHLIKVTDKKEGDIKSLDEVKEEISKQLIASKQQNLYFSKVDELKNKYDIKILK